MSHKNLIYHNPKRNARDFLLFFYILVTYDWTWMNGYKDFISPLPCRIASTMGSQKLAYKESIVLAIL